MSNLPYLTDAELNAPVKAVEIKIWGSYTKRGENRKDVYEDHYEAVVVVPAQYDMGHVKLMANRLVKRELHGIRARTWNVDKSVKPTAYKPPEGTTLRRRDFMSDMALNDNERAKQEHQRKMAQIKAQRDRERSGDNGPDGMLMDDELPPETSKGAYVS